MNPLTSGYSEDELRFGGLNIFFNNKNKINTMESDVEEDLRNHR